MLWESITDYIRHHLDRVLMIAVGAAVGLAIMATDIPPAHGAEAARADPDAATAYEGPRMRAGLTFAVGDRLADILDTAADGETVVWRDDKAGISYRVHPLSTFKAGQQSCRAFLIRRTSHDGIRESYRTACRAGDGGWGLTTASDTGGNG